MDIDILKKIASDGESASVEFKKSTADLAGACESLCGMLNADVHPNIFIGVHNGKLTGQEISDRTQQEIANCLKEFSPDPNIHFSLIHLEGKRSIIYLTAKSNAKYLPYFFRGKAFLRIGTTTTHLSRERLIGFIMEQHRHHQPYDSLVTKDYHLEDIDAECVLRAVEWGIAANRMPIAARGNIEKILDQFELIRDGCLTNAAIILFGKNESRLPLQCTLMAARFKGIGKGEFLDNKQFRGNAFQLLDDGMMFLSRHLPLRGRFEKNNLRRIEEPLIPSEALREALLNAICHRDYEFSGSCIHLAIYDDRVEITSNGSLMPGNQISDLKKQHKSILRNPRIAKVFYHTGLIEQWGQGTLKMIQLCKSFGLPEPEFNEHPLWFEICFNIPSGSLQKSQTRQEQILEMLITHKSLSAKEFNHLLPHMNRRMIQRVLQNLKERNLIQSSSKGPATVWSIGSDRDRITTESRQNRDKTFTQWSLREEEEGEK